MTIDEHWNRALPAVRRRHQRRGFILYATTTHVRFSEVATQAWR
jgi:hypothetical protein